MLAMMAQQWSSGKLKQLNLKAALRLPVLLSLLLALCVSILALQQLRLLIPSQLLHRGSWNGQACTCWPWSNGSSSGSSSRDSGAGSRRGELAKLELGGRGGVLDSRELQDEGDPPLSAGRNRSRLGVESSERVQFRAHGSAAALFVEMSAYRGGPATFAILGLASKPAVVFKEATFRCSWAVSAEDDADGGEDDDDDNDELAGTAWQMLPDWGLGRVYTTVVINCTFPRPVGGSGTRGGRLLLTVLSRGQVAEKFTVLHDEAAAGAGTTGSTGTTTGSTGNPSYEHVYCGSPLYGRLNPRRVREWLAYHAWLLGPRSHFVIYDAGGVGPAVARALAPWRDRGRVTLLDVRDQEARFDGYYHNQFLAVNDCLFRTRDWAAWTSFFDLDEYLYVPVATTGASGTGGDDRHPAPRALRRLLRRHAPRATQLLIRQVPVRAGLCMPSRSRAGGDQEQEQQWGLEALVYRLRRPFTRAQQDRKYAVQPRSVFSAGVHLSQNLDGNTTVLGADELRYYHYHGTINRLGSLCDDDDDHGPGQQLADDDTVTSLKPAARRAAAAAAAGRGFGRPSKVNVKEAARYVYDGSMADLVPVVKRFEERTIGPVSLADLRPDPSDDHEFEHDR